MQQDMSEEPLKNINLESAILGLKMTLTSEEETEARRRFLDILRESVLAVPTMSAVATQADGSILPGADISLLIVTSDEGISGVPTFTQLGFLRAVLPQMEHGMFLSGSQLGGILSGTDHKLFVDGPDIHAEVEAEELQMMVQAAQIMEQMQQQAAGSNERLETALGALSREDTTDHRDAVMKAFLEEFSRVPIAGDQDEDADCIVLSTGAVENTPETPQELEMLTQDDALLCFTSEDAMRLWDPSGRTSVVLPGPVIAQVAAQAEVNTLLINKGSADQRVLRIADGRVEVI